MLNHDQTPKQMLDDILRALGFLVVAIVFIAIILRSPGGVNALIAILIILTIHVALRIFVWLVRVTVTGIAAALQAVSKIRIKRPVRPPSKREIAAWLAGDFKETNQMLDESQLDDDERSAGKRQAKIDYIKKLNDLFPKRN